MGTTFCKIKGLFLFLLVLQLIPQILCGWQTVNHDPGYCAMREICGKESDNILNCAQNILAPEADADLSAKMKEVCPMIWEPNGRYCCDINQLELLENSIDKAQNLICKCPACNENFWHFFCTFTCSPNQAEFLDILSVQDCTDEKTGKILTNCVDTVDFYVAPYFGKKFYNSCKDVKMPYANIRAMDFIGGGAKNYHEFFSFLGLQKDKRFFHQGSPFQIDFPNISELPSDMQAMNASIYNCWDQGEICSCSDCPDAPACRAHSAAAMKGFW